MAIVSEKTATPFYTKDNKSDTWAVSLKYVKSEKSEVEKHVSLRGSH